MSGTRASWLISGRLQMHRFRFSAIGDDLQLVFADGGTTLIKGFFLGDADAGVAVLGDGQVLTLRCVHHRLEFAGD